MCGVHRWRVWGRLKGREGEGAHKWGVEKG